jgi:hypothetical protein
MAASAVTPALYRRPTTRALPVEASVVVSESAKHAETDINLSQDQSSGSVRRMQPDAQALLDRYYLFSDRGTVVRYLEFHPQLAPVLINLATLVPEYFARAERVLRVVQAAPLRGAPDGRRLVLFILTDLDDQAAMEQMDRLMAAWLPDVRVKLPAPFTVDVALGTGAAALDSAVERFSKRHGVGYTAYLSAARRLLKAPDGSDEQAEARALFETAPRQDISEGSTQALGGEASAVLARLRRQHSSGHV